MIKIEKNLTIVLILENFLLSLPASLKCEQRAKDTKKIFLREYKQLKM